MRHARGDSGRFLAFARRPPATGRHLGEHAAASGSASLGRVQRLRAGRRLVASGVTI